jgi:hypothetical protein
VKSTIQNFDEADGKIRMIWRRVSWGVSMPNSTPFSMIAIEKPAFGSLLVSGIFIYYAVHVPDTIGDAYANYRHTNYRLGWALS